jgi:hypothetical protein
LTVGGQRSAVSVFGIWILEFGICLEFGPWNLEFEENGHQNPHLVFEFPRFLPIFIQNFS